MSIDRLREVISDVISDQACSAEFYFLLDSGGGIKIDIAQ